ncbi:MAG: hypothetical protein MOB07_12975 [Acidobacteria bacterium]|nr:hypothetical protein [Acidobacteriota bacterium]
MNDLLRRYARKALTNVAIPAACVVLVSALGLPSASDTIVRSSAASSEEVYFIFGLPPRPETFIVKLTDPAKIKTARDILSGVEKNVIGISGAIVKSPACYNQPWSFHLDPESIFFFGVAPEVCDGSIQGVEDNLADIGGSTLPGNRWCPWASRLLREIPKPDCPSNTVTSVSAASYRRTRLASEAIAAAFGSNLSGASESASSLPLPTSLAGTTVKVKDSQGVERLSPLLFVSPAQINYIIPAGTAPAMATVTVTDARGNVTTGTEMIMQVGPGFFTADGSGQGIPAALALRVKRNEITYEPIARYDAEQQKFVLIPIDLGPEAGAATEQVFLVLFGTGFRSREPLPAGPAAVFGDTTFVEPLYIGAQPDYPGLDQVNLPIPRSLIGKGEVEIRMIMDDKGANRVRISVK